MWSFFFSYKIPTVVTDTGVIVGSPCCHSLVSSRTSFQTMATQGLEPEVFVFCLRGLIPEVVVSRGSDIIVEPRFALLSYP